MIDWMRMHALADGQLEGEEKKSAEAQLRECLQSGAEFRTVESLKECLQSKAERQECSKTWHSCLSRLNELDKRRRTEAFVGRYAWGLCSVFLVLIAGAAMLNRSLGSPELRTGDVAKIVSGVADLSVRGSSSGEDMSRWMLKLDTGTLSVLQEQRGWYQNRAAARFVLADADGPLHLVLMKGTEPLSGVEPMIGDSGFSYSMIDGMHGVTWFADGFVFMLVGSRPPDELCRLARSVRLRR